MERNTQKNGLINLLLVLAVSLFGGGLAWLRAQQPTYDLLISGGHIVDGTEDQPACVTRSE